MNRTIVKIGRGLPWATVALLLFIGNVAAAPISLAFLIYGSPLLLALLIGYAAAKRKQSKNTLVFKYLLLFFFALPPMIMLAIAIKTTLP